jgi:hypothetical protein
MAIASSSVLYLASMIRVRGENRLDYRYDNYVEEGGRIRVITDGVYFDTDLKAWLSLQGDFVYDSISGATPQGSPPLPGESSVATVPMNDRRYAGSIEPTFKFSNHALSPQFSYSEESDYRSIGIALNDAMDFNEKNTTVTWGGSHSFDQVLPNDGELQGRVGVPITSSLDKNDTAGFVGLSQLLNPATIVTANLTLGYADGFLNDPYKRVLFDGFPYTSGMPYTVFPESRPGHRFRQVVFLSLQHDFEKAKGAVELTYRFYNDSYGIIANTVSIQWNQKIGKHVIVSPLFRYYTQTAADFYGTHFPGDPSDPSSPIPIPSSYSSDYRLSELETFTYGVTVSARVQKHLSLEVAYMRYEMYGLDGVTAAAQYPKANVFSGGLTIWF